MAEGEFYETDSLEQVAINLFYGWGYNFYRIENQLRADDQLVRAKAGAILVDCRLHVDKLEGAYRRANIPAPTRAKPFPDPEVMRNAQALERFSGAIGALEGQVRAQPVPENDRMTQFYRREGETLLRLGKQDRLLVGRAETLRHSLEALDFGDALLGALPEFEAAMRELGAILRARRAVLEADAT